MNQIGETEDCNAQIHTFATAVSLGLNTHKCASPHYQLHSLAGKSASQIPHSDNEQISFVSRSSNSEPQRVRFIHKLLLKWILHMIKRIIIPRHLWPILETYVGCKSPPVQGALEQNRSASSPPGTTTTYSASHWGLSAMSLQCHVSSVPCLCTAMPDLSSQLSAWSTDEKRCIRDWYHQHLCTVKNWLRAELYGSSCQKSLFSYAAHSAKREKNTTKGTSHKSLHRDNHWHYTWGPKIMQRQLSQF